MPRCRFPRAVHVHSLFAQAWPPTAAVRELATQIKKRKKGMSDSQLAMGYRPFVFADLKK